MLALVAAVLLPVAGTSFMIDFSGPNRRVSVNIAERACTCTLSTMGRYGEYDVV